MAFLKFYILCFIYLISLLYLTCLQPAKQPTIAFLMFVVSHLCLYLIIFDKNLLLLKHKFSGLKSIILLAIVLRILFFWYAPSDDLARYAWEGKQVSRGVNPYLHAPQWFTVADIKGLSERDKSSLIQIIEIWSNKKINPSDTISSELQMTLQMNQMLLDKSLPNFLEKAFDLENNAIMNHSQLTKDECIQKNKILIMDAYPSLQDDFYKNINHKEFPAIYPPIALIVFSMLVKISYSVQAFKFLFIILDIISIVFIVKLLEKNEKPLHWSLLYVMSPLVLLYGIGECHLDIMLNVFMVSGIYLILYSKFKRWIALGFFLLGCSVVTKYLSLIIIPFLINRKNYKLLIFFFFPFITFLSFLEPGMFSSLSVFSGQMHFNDAIPRIVRIFILEGGVIYLSIIFCIYILGFMMIYLLYQADMLGGILLAWVWLLFCLPVFHPWYLMSILVLSCFYPSRAILFLSMILGLNFFVVAHQFNHNGVWVEFWWLPISTFLGLILAYFCEIKWTNPLYVKEFKSINSLDIVIPVYNESNKIGKALENLVLEADNLKRLKNIDTNILIVDGGSDDDTRSILNDYPVKIEISEKGRGIQLAHGFEKGSSDLVLFLHADSTLKPNALVLMTEALQKNPFLTWGILGHKYDNRNFKLRIVENLNYFRFKYLGIAFGDQGMFFRREILNIVKVPKIPLMEDIEISLRLMKYRSRIKLNDLLIGSARRWEKRKFFKSFAQVIFLSLKYFVHRRLGSDIHAISKKIYKIYYS